MNGQCALSMRLHDGPQFLSDWRDADDCAKIHVVQMAENAYETAKTFGNSPRPFHKNSNKLKK